MSKNLPSDFSAAIYEEINLDLRGLSEDDLISHYLNHGQFEEYRLYKPNIEEYKLLPVGFCPAVYRCLNPSLSLLNDYQLVRHYVRYGKQEKKSYEDKYFSEVYFLYQNFGSLYDLYIKDIRRPKNEYFKNWVDDYMRKENSENKSKKYIFLVNHSDTTYGASRYLYLLFQVLKRHFEDRKEICVKLCEIEYKSILKDNFGIENEEVIEYKDDATLFYMYYEAMKPSVVYLNSCNFVFTKVYSFIPKEKRILHSHEIFEHYMLSKEIIPDLVVSQRIKQEYIDYYTLNLDLATKIQIQVPFLQNIDEIIELSNEKALLIKNSFKTMDKTLITIGMCGQISSRKNYQLFIDISQQYQQYNFLWIGDTCDIFAQYENIFHIKETNNPYKYFRQIIDYFVLFSNIDPCPYVVLENILLETRIITFKENIYYEHIDPLIEDLYFSYPTSISLASCKNAFTSIVKSKRKTTELSGSGIQYIKKYFYKPTLSVEVITNTLLNP